MCLFFPWGTTDIGYPPLLILRNSVARLDEDIAGLVCRALPLGYFILFLFLSLFFSAGPRSEVVCLLCFRDLCQFLLFITELHSLTGMYVLCVYNNSSVCRAQMDPSVFFAEPNTLLSPPSLHRYRFPISSIIIGYRSR